MRGFDGNDESNMYNFFSKLTSPKTKEWSFRKSVGLYTRSKTSCDSNSQTREREKKKLKVSKRSRTVIPRAMVTPPVASLCKKTFVPSCCSTTFG